MVHISIIACSVISSKIEILNNEDAQKKCISDLLVTSLCGLLGSYFLRLKFFEQKRLNVPPGS